MQINLTWDGSVQAAPNDFTSAMAAAAQYLDYRLVDPVTINISVGYGEVDGTALGSTDLGSSTTLLQTVSYTALRNALASDQSSSLDASALASLPTTSPVGGTLFISTAQAKALGLKSPTASATDGYVGFSSSVPYTFDDSGGVASGTYDFAGIALHEITEVMGRITFDGTTIGGAANSYDLLDLFHYSAPGVLDFSGSSPGYFSPDGGETDLGTFNTLSGGDTGDWSSSMGNDAFDAFSNAGVVNSVSSDDFAELDAIGWNFAPTTPTGQSTLAVVASTIVVDASEDAWQGNAQFTVSIDGQQIGGTYTATTLHASEQTQSFSISDDLTPGQHTIGVTFINDAYGGSSSTDRNLYVDSVSVNGQVIADSQATLFSDGTASFTGTVSDNSSNTPTTPTTPASPTPPATPTNPSTGLVLNMSEDAYDGDAEFTVSVNGQQVGGTYNATASNTGGQSEAFSIPTTLGSGANTVGITFINDAYESSVSTDRNLYLDSATVNGTTVSGRQTLLSDGIASFSFYGNDPTPVVTSSLVLNVSEDAYQGDGEMVVAVDGQTMGYYTVTASHAAGQTQAITVDDILESFNPHDIAVSFVNDAYGGSPSLDRNLYVNSMQLDGQTVSGGSGAFLSNDTQHFTGTAPANWTS